MQPFTKLNFSRLIVDQYVSACPENPVHKGQ